MGPEQKAGTWTVAKGWWHDLLYGKDPLVAEHCHDQMYSLYTLSAKDILPDTYNSETAASSLSMSAMHFPATLEQTARF